MGSLLVVDIGIGLFYMIVVSTRVFKDEHLHNIIKLAY